ncbi:MAG TPA: nuclear transport factor 2 family protein [Candidatus Aquilonibacter sp.]|nr:nuclear transport factor 2 family protein [Candidatus Aquilonibacter sp.]
MNPGSMFGAVLLLASVIPGVAQAPAPILTSLQQTLVNNEKSLIEAKKRDDATFFKRTVSDDFTLVGPDGQMLQGREAVDNLGDSDLVELMPYDIKVMPEGDDAAIVTYDAIVREKHKEDEGPQPRYQHFTSIWVKQQDGWKLNFQQATPTRWGDW